MFLSHDWIAGRLSIAPHTKVLDIGGAAARFDRGDVTVVDLFEPDWDCRFARVDVCREPLPFADDEFDVCICTHTLEDLYAPFLVMDEMQRVAKRGYIETPHRGLEMCFSVAPSKGVFPGWGHHHWMFELAAPGRIRVLPKSWHLLRHDAEKIVHWAGPSQFEFFWHEGFAFEIAPEPDASRDTWEPLLLDHREFLERNRRFLLTEADAGSRLAAGAHEAAARAPEAKCVVPSPAPH